jgi:hypothetical protein
MFAELERMHFDIGLIRPQRMRGYMGGFDNMSHGEAEPLNVNVLDQLP